MYVGWDVFLVKIIKLHFENKIFSYNTLNTKVKNEYFLLKNESLDGKSWGRDKNNNVGI